MKDRFQSDYMAPAALLGLSFLLLGIALLTDRGEMTTAVLILCATSCFAVSILLFGFAKKESVDGDFAALLPVPGTLTLSRICADLNVQGDACFIPRSSDDGPGVVQFNPVGPYTPPEITSDETYLTKGEGKGVVTTPAGWYVLERLMKENSLIIPSEEEGLGEVMKEVATEILDAASGVSFRRSGDDLVIEVRGYRLMEGCRRVREESPKCCTMAPCPFCSTLACMTALSRQSPISISSITTNYTMNKITLVLSEP